MSVLLEGSLDRHLSDDEFIDRYESAGRPSPIIQALMLRLQLANHTHKIPKDLNARVECPVCLASLEVEMDEDNGRFSLTSNEQ